MARSITTRRPLWVQEVISRTARSATPPTARRWTACGWPSLGPDRGLRGRAGRLRDQPRREPRRRHHLLGHGRGGAGGRRARAAGDRRLPAVRRRESSTTASTAVRLRAWPRFIARWSPSCEEVPLPAGTLLNINVPAGEAGGRRGDEARQAHLPRRAEARAEEDQPRRRYWIYGARPGLPRRAGHRSGRGRRGRDRGHADPLRPHRPPGPGGAAGLSTWRALHRARAADAATER